LSTLKTLNAILGNAEQTDLRNSIDTGQRRNGRFHLFGLRGLIEGFGGDDPRQQQCRYQHCKQGQTHRPIAERSIAFDDLTPTGALDIAASDDMDTIGVDPCGAFHRLPTPAKGPDDLRRGAD